MSLIKIFTPSGSHQVAFHPSAVDKSSTSSFGWGCGANVASVGRQVKLCDSIWHTSSESGEVLCMNCCMRFSFNLTVVSQSHAVSSVIFKLSKAVLPLARSIDGLLVHSCFKGNIVCTTQDRASGVKIELTCQHQFSICLFRYTVLLYLPPFCYNLNG